MTGSLNLRDVGGLPTEDGRRVRIGRLFRSAAPQWIAAEDADRLYREYGVMFVVDFRNADESAGEGRGQLEQFPICHINVPLVDSSFLLEDSDGSDAHAAKVLAAGGPLMAQYLANLRHPNLAIAVGIVVHAVAREPTVLHCAFGKDRTGMVVAMVLSMLGVTEEAITADYMATDDSVEMMIERTRNSPRYKPYVDLGDLSIFHCYPDTMRTFLRELRERHGGATEWALQHGVAAASIDRLRAALLEEPGGAGEETR
ncbi:MAG: tyrosine-protein phosphatase [Actinobacteria bacterium]|nr:tyrosine-protein phosphatase [Actinomycetota bacterium]